MYLTRPSLYCPSLVICIFFGSWDWPDPRERPRRLCWTSVNPSNYIWIWQLHSYTTPRMLRAFAENRCECVRNIPKTWAYLLLKVGKVGGVSLCGGFTPARCWERSPFPTAERRICKFYQTAIFPCFSLSRQKQMKWKSNLVAIFNQYTIKSLLIRFRRARSNHGGMFGDCSCMPVNFAVAVSETALCSDAWSTLDFNIGSMFAEWIALAAQVKDRHNSSVHCHLRFFDMCTLWSLILIQYSCPLKVTVEILFKSHFNHLSGLFFWGGGSWGPNPVALSLIVLSLGQF